MKILFLCQYNIGRSRIAETLFKTMAKKSSAISAGFDEKFVNTRYADAAPLVIRCMNEMNLKIRKRKARIVTEKMISDADFIIALMSNSAVNGVVPKRIRDMQNFTHWRIDDVSLRQDYNYGKLLAVIEEIRKRVKKLVEQNDL